jgi:hypothetical protein
LLRKLDDPPGNDLRCRITAVDQAQSAQGLVEGGAENLDLVWAERVNSQQPMNRH